MNAIGNHTHGLLSATGQPTRRVWIPRDHVSIPVGITNGRRGGRW